MPAGAALDVGFALGALIKDALSHPAELLGGVFRVALGIHEAGGRFHEFRSHLGIARHYPCLQQGLELPEASTIRPIAAVGVNSVHRQPCPFWAQTKIHLPGIAFCCGLRDIAHPEFRYPLGDLRRRLGSACYTTGAACAAGAISCFSPWRIEDYGIQVGSVKHLASPERTQADDAHARRGVASHHISQRLQSGFRSHRCQLGYFTADLARAGYPQQVTAQNPQPFSSHEPSQGIAPGVLVLAHWGNCRFQISLKLLLRPAQIAFC